MSTESKKVKKAIVTRFVMINYTFLFLIFYSIAVCAMEESWCYSPGLFSLLETCVRALVLDQKPKTITDIVLGSVEFLS